MLLREPTDNLPSLGRQRLHDVNHGLLRSIEPVQSEIARGVGQQVLPLHSLPLPLRTRRTMLLDNS